MYNWCLTKPNFYAFPPKSCSDSDFYWKLVSPVSIGNKRISFVNEADHVGITRSISGNLPHILGRMTAHNKAVISVLSAGLARVAI